MFYVAATTLTGLHFTFTTVMTLVLKWLGFIQPSHLPLPDLLRFVVFANFSIVGMNVSLMWNSVGFYQVKLCFSFHCARCCLIRFLSSSLTWGKKLFMFFRLQSWVWSLYPVCWRLCSIKVDTPETQSAA